MGGWKPVRYVVWRPILVLLAVAAAAATAERIAPLQALHVYLVSRPNTAHWLSLLALNVAAIGVLLLVAARFLVRLGEEVPPAGPLNEGAAQLLPVERRRRGSTLGRRRIGEPAPMPDVGAGSTPPISLREALAVLRSGTCPSTPRWQRFCLSGLGAVCIGTGVLGFAFVVGAPFVKLLVLMMIAGAGVWSVWAVVARRG